MAQEARNQSTGSRGIEFSYVAFRAGSVYGSKG